MKLFGRYVALPFVFLAALDSMLFFAVLHTLSLGPHCYVCYFGSLVTLKLYEVVGLTAAFLLIATSVGIYNRDAVQDFPVFLKRFFLSWQLIFVPAVAFTAISKIAAGAPFGWYVGILSLAIAMFMALLFTIRIVMVWCLRLPFVKKREMIFGSGRKAETVAAFIAGPGKCHLAFVKMLAPEDRYPATTSSEGNLALKLHPQNPSPVLAIAHALKIDEIIVAVDDPADLPLWELLECKLSGIDVIDYLTFWEREAGEVDFTCVGPGWFAFSEGFLLNQPRRLLKRAVDFAVSFAFLVAMLPVIAVTMTAIKLESPGPVFYRQERVGLNGKTFSVWKFRSMRVDAEKEGVPLWASTHDSRVTRVGHFIRKYRIDEIPQIINVLAGDMSFIGPRPERPFFVEELHKKIPYYHLRHRVKPGITGWAQVNYPYGASIEDAKRKLAYDLYYVKKNEVFLDFTILIQTVRVILFTQGAR
ncbi:MAG TPA: TIGR03013 family XrtA/PEP-CTERM system glycosyltransferase [Rhizomicrobium sp.]